MQEVDKMQNKEKSFLLNVDTEVWNRFKDNIPRRKSIHNQIVELIKEFTENKKQQ